MHAARNLVLLGHTMYVQQVLVRELEPVDIVIMYNLFNQGEVPAGSRTVEAWLQGRLHLKPNVHRAAKRGNSTSDFHPDGDGPTAEGQLPVSVRCKNVGIVLE